MGKPMILYVLGAASLLASGCGDSDSNGPGPIPPGPATDLIGKWMGIVGFDIADTSRICGGPLGGWDCTVRRGFYCPAAVEFSPSGPAADSIRVGIWTIDAAACLVWNPDRPSDPAKPGTDSAVTMATTMVTTLRHLKSPDQWNTTDTFWDVTTGDGSAEALGHLLECEAEMPTASVSHEAWSAPSWKIAGHPTGSTAYLTSTEVFRPYVPVYGLHLCKGEILRLDGPWYQLYR